MFICWQKINFILHVLLEILLIVSTCSYDFDVSLHAKKQISSFTSSLWHSIFKNPAIRWWNINNNISFHLSLFPGKTNDKIFQKKSKHLILGLGKKEKFSWKKGLCQFLNIPIMYHRLKNQKTLMTQSWEKYWMTDGMTDRQRDRRTDKGDFIGPSVTRGSNKDWYKHGTIQ